MFDDLIRELQKMEKGMQVPIQLEPDEAGFLDRLCPDERCGAEFKVLSEDWRDKVRDEAAFCPLCRHEAASTQWNTPAQNEQIKQIKADALRYAHGRINTALSSAARNFNRSQSRDGMISMSMSYRPASLPVVVPASASDLLRQTFECDVCHCHHSSLGAAFFCPACGHNSAVSTFQVSVDTVRKTLDALSGIRQSVCEATDADAAEDSVRHILENSLVKLVSSFQGYAEALFDTVPNRAQFTPRRNLFLNLHESNDLWRAAVGEGYDGILSPQEYSSLEVYFQQRHLLAHTDGIVDQDYLDRSGDNSYALGQRLVIRPQAVGELADSVERLAHGLRERT